MRAKIEGGRVWLMATIMILFGQPVLAQAIPEQTESDRRQMRRAAERTIEMILGDYRGLLSDAERRVVDRIDITVSNSINIYRVYARLRDGRRSIEFSVGWLTTMEMVQDAAILTTLSGNGGRDDMLRYIDDLAQTVWENGRRDRLGQPMVASGPYPLYLGRSASEVREIYRDPAFQDARVTVKVHTIALILAHEIAHHVLGHLEGPRSGTPAEMAAASRIREQEADDWAINLANGAGYSTAVSAFPFLFYALLESEEEDPLRTHPVSTCRAAQALVEGVDQAMGDQGFVDYLEATNQLADYELMRDEAEAELANC